MRISRSPSTPGHDGFQVLGDGLQVPAVAEIGARGRDAPGLDEELVQAAFG